MKKWGLLPLIVLLDCRQPTLQVGASKRTLLANGYDSATIQVLGARNQPAVQSSGAHVRTEWKPNGRLVVTAGVMPGSAKVSIVSKGERRTEAFQLLPQTTDSVADGTPDFARLEDESDRKAFREWLAYLAEIQYFAAPAKRTAEITDCSALVRYAYREALRDHNSAWAAEAHLPVVPAMPSIQKYFFPHTLLGPRIFRTRGGSYIPSDLTGATFSEFANAKTLQHWNLFFVSRDIARAEPADILFYRRPTTKGVSYHSMIFIGPSRVNPDGGIYVVYHTGPDGTDDGEIRRLTISQLLHFPNPQWHSIAANPLFLGVYRWNILKALS